MRLICSLSGVAHSQLHKRFACKIREVCGSIYVANIKGLTHYIIIVIGLRSVLMQNNQVVPSIE